MAASERLYILKTVDGEEYGPVDQDCLIRWAENGRITAYCQIRSTLIARWENASEVPFLRELLLKQLEEKDSRNESILGKIRRRATMRAVEIAVSNKALISILSTPIPARPITLRLAAAAMIFFVDR